MLSLSLNRLPAHYVKQPCSSLAAKLFDAMSDRVDEGNMETAVAGGEDHITALPDELLQCMMSFLLSRDAVRTCVLAKRWRTLWKSVPALRIDDPESYDGATGSSPFVDELLRLRDPTPLNVCVISSDCEDMVGDDPDWDEEVFGRIAPWLQYALSREVHGLRVDFPLRVANMTLVSSHLKRLTLCNMRFEGHSLDFSSCQVLEVLEIIVCDIFSGISSQSLKYLYIDGSSFDWDTRKYILAPNLVGFRLFVVGGLTPSICSMPSLVTASVTLGEGCAKFCCRHTLCVGCGAEASDVDRSIVLQGLSGATNLELVIYDPAVFVFRKDLTNLKTLLLNYWCVVDGLSGLIYFLQHSPILEMLTIDVEFQSHQEELEIETNESYYKPGEHLLLSKHLKVVTILCQTREDVLVPHILKILSDHGVPSEKIDIQSEDEED